MRQLLDEKKLQLLESKVEQNPKDFDSRFKIIEDLSGKRYHDESVKPDLFRHIYWLIENDPAREVLQQPYCCIDQILDEEYIPKATELYEKALADHPGNPSVISNVAWFYQRLDNECAEELLKRCCELSPKNDRYQSRLGLYYSLLLQKASNGRGSERCSKEISKLALKAYEASYSLLEGEKESQFYQLADLSMAAYKAGADTKASKFAQELLDMAPDYKGNWNYSNAWHKGYIVQGLLALRAENVEVACEKLILAGNNPGSPQLSSFGPNLELAQLLLNAGCHQSVLEYLRSCQKFHKHHNGFYEKALSLIAGGESPGLEDLKYDYDDEEIEDEE